MTTTNPMEEVLRLIQGYQELINEQLTVIKFIEERIDRLIEKESKP